VRKLDAAAALILFAVLAVPAEGRVRCDSGTTAFVDGKLRIFGVHYRTPDEWGFEEYACLGRRRKPLYVGGVGSDTGVGSAETPVYAHAGRYLADYSQSDGEGGPSSHVTVVDLVRRRAVSFMNLACCEGVPPLRLAADGTVAVLAPGDGVLVKAPDRRTRTLSGDDARDLAMHGGTVYWTEARVARSATLDGVGGGEARALEPVRLRRGRTCGDVRGRTIAATGSVRVFAQAGERFGCRIGRPGQFVVERGSARIVADRWVLARDARRARVFDSQTGHVVASARPATNATLLQDGTLVALQPGGRLLAQASGGRRVLLAAAGARALAAARRAVYWTEAGIPRVYRPPSSAARSASKPG
jgi:hypothetical protein